MQKLGKNLNVFVVHFYWNIKIFKGSSENLIASLLALKAQFCAMQWHKQKHIPAWNEIPIGNPSYNICKKTIVQVQL